MKLLFVILSALLLTACPSPTSNPSSGGIKHYLTQASVTGAKGVFLAGSSVSSRSVMGRSLVSGTASTLQQITATSTDAAIHIKRLNHRVW